MGFMDKAKKMAEQAQSKLDEVQKQFNEGQSSGQHGDGAPVQYDKHGRPVNDPAAAPPAPEAAAVPAPPTPDPADPPADVPVQQEPAKVQGDPLLDEQEQRPSAPPAGGTPGLTSGDPLG